MYSRESSHVSSGVSILEVVGIVFIILKLVDLIDWDWWIVLLPVYAPLVLVFFIAIIYSIFEK